ncbi:DNA topoisomerase III, partial [Alcaligenes faecalis subsp. faecalis NCIB 8687]
MLSAMESAGKLVDDEALREAMSERGLGTVGIWQRSAGAKHG